MAVTATLDDGGKALSIRVSGRFDFKSHQDFRSAYKQTAGRGVRYEVDVGGAEYMDSSALGMLLMLREHAGGEDGDVRITNARGEIRNILNISNFERLFRIE